MPRYVAFLRGMNLGGRRITNDELRARFEGLGLADVATFRASGNVIFGTEDREPPNELTRRIELGLAASLGYDVPVFLRAASEVRAIAEYEPFEPALVEASAGKLQVSLLAARPTVAARNAALALATDEDRLVQQDRELYWLPSGGLLESALDLDAIDRLLGTSTRRTKGTIELIAAKHCAP